MKRNTLLVVAVLAALGAGTAMAAAQADSAARPATRINPDKNNDGAIDRAEAAALPRLAGKFDALDKNKDSKLTADERPHRGDMQGGMHGGHHGGKDGAGAAFAKLDTNQDGRLSRTEAAADPKFAERFDKMDANKDGVIDRTDHEARAKQHREERFTAADTDKDGKLSRAEFEAADSKRREQGYERFQAHATERFAAADTNKDDKLSRDEVKANPRMSENFDRLDANKDGFLGKDELPSRKGAMR